MTYKAKKENRRKAGILLATACHFSGLYALLVLAALIMLAIFQIGIFSGVLNR